MAARWRSAHEREVPLHRARFEDHAEHVDAIVRAVLAAADAGGALERSIDNLIERAPAPGDGTGEVVERMRGGAPLHVVAFGKASMEMTRSFCRRFGDRVVGGAVAAVPERMGGEPLPARVRIWPADHPLPTERNVAAAGAVADVARGAGASGPRGTLVALISGGGSAHLSWPVAGLGLEDIVGVTGLLLRAGASIDELNTVRKHIERLKGGRLAAIAAPARAVAFVVSDVPGDRLDLVASGPLAPDPTTFADALAVLRDRGVDAPRVESHLRMAMAGGIAENPKPGDPLFERVLHRIIASNALGVEAAADAVESLGFKVLGLETGIGGEARAAGEALARREAAMPRDVAPAAWIAGGETTVVVGSAVGRGGRCQEMALAAALAIDGRGGVAIACFGTDGVDGPTDAAGAIVQGGTCARARQMGLDPAGMLAAHDSYTFFVRSGGHIRTGPTGTNVNDVAVVLRY